MNNIYKYTLSVMLAIVVAFTGCTTNKTQTTIEECTATEGVYSVFIDENYATGSCDSKSNHNMFKFQQDVGVYIEKNENYNGRGCNLFDVYETSGNDMVSNCNITHKYYFEYVVKTVISGTIVTVRDCYSETDPDTCKSSANFKFVLK